MDWVDLIQGFGFPIALSVYLIIRDTRDKASLVKRIEQLEEQRLEKEEKRTDHLTSVVERNTTVLSNLGLLLRTHKCLANGASNLTGE